MSLLVTMSNDGIEATYTILGGWTGELMVLFLTQILFPKLREDRGDRSRMLVMDNARCHHCDMVEHTIKEEGHRLHFLPPYTPWFNPTERVFSAIKPAVARQELKDHGSLEAAIDKQLDTITQETCKAWIRECKRWAQVAVAGHPLSPEHDAETALRSHGLLPDEEILTNMTQFDGSDSDNNDGNAAADAGVDADSNNAESSLTEMEVSQEM